MKSRTLTALVASSALALGSCGDRSSPYIFKGQLGNEKVAYTVSSPIDIAVATLEIAKEDGRTIIYWDADIDDRVDRVLIYKDNRKQVEYDSSTTEGKEVLKEAQRQFDSYLLKISESKKQRELEAIESFKQSS